MIVGIGVDLVDIAEFKNSILTSDRIKEKLFTPNEIMFSDISLAACFASKEALIKAIGNYQLFKWKSAEIEHDKFGKPMFLFHDELSEHMKYYEVLLSISHTKALVQAVVILQAR
jgi:holo-[acyl-carrier protein] synthase